MPKYFIFGGCQENSAARASPSTFPFAATPRGICNKNSEGALAGFVAKTNNTNNFVLQRQTPDKCAWSGFYFEDTGEKSKSFKHISYPSNNREIK